jgi:hypothetical protein
MEKRNVIELTAYREACNDCLPSQGISNELEEAIGQLIQRLREANPIQ